MAKTSGKQRYAGDEIDAGTWKTGEDRKQKKKAREAKIASNQDYGSTGNVKDVSTNRMPEYNRTCKKMVMVMLNYYKN